ncbi:threonine ammonia-lyase [Fusibacter sp. 3D3]|uniref:threonine ammonia-lyase n=1 Tax=Fusibacter sp. 3D3 TaxID=1048380 RepID=UPI000856E385|nr:threonine ammonia-lyase [Fusibacter sp. 3D3]GAU79749.1 threonine dehydratase [Fusibacter sp. 3D3]
MSTEKGLSKLMITEAMARLKPVINETRLIYSDIFSQEFSNQIYIKPENLQKTGSFKIRGAFNMIAQLDDDSLKKGVVASSAGNHAQGVALAAQTAGCQATIVMPTATPLIKVNATKAYGAEVVLHGDCYDEAYDKACEIQREMGYTFIHPFNDHDVIAGQGTIGIEILNELPDADYVLVPVGGGGLIAGVAYAVKSINPNCKVFGVEPEGAMSMKASLDKGSVVKLENIHTIADGVAVKAVGNLPFDISNQYVDGIIAVNDYDIMEAFLLLIEKHKIVAENAGALTIAALKNFKVKGKKIVCILSGGNIDVVTVSAMINKGLSSRGRIFCFSVELPDTPGQLLKISQVLSDLKANVIKLDHNQFMNLDRFMHVQLQVTVETNGHDHIQQISDELHKIGYQVNRVY